MPGLTGDYFAATLTYVCEHTDQGALGIIVNRSTDLSLLELFSQLGLESSRRFAAQPVLEGGPVAQERGFVLHSADKTFESSVQLTDNLYMSTAIDALQAIASDRGPQHYLVALGYAGWGAGQLEDEIANNVWLTAPGTNPEEILFSTPLDKRLNAAAQSLGIDFSLIAAKPGHA